MYRVSFRGHRGFSDDLGEARVGMHGHPDLLWRALDELGEDAFGDEVRDLRPYGVHPEDQICLLVGDDFEEPVGLALDKRLAYSPERELRLPDLVTLLLGLRFGEPERRHLGPTEGYARDEVPVLGHRVLACHVLDGDEQGLGLQGVATSFAGLTGGRVFAAIRAAFAFRLLLLA